MALRVAVGALGVLAWPVGGRTAAAQAVVGPPLATLSAPPRSGAARRARDAAREYERARRRSLPELRGGGGSDDRCDVRIGRFCYWDNNNDVPVAPEPRTAAAQPAGALFAALDRAAAAEPADDWVAGQRVRYLLEAGRAADANRAAAECRGTAWWCQALVGLARHAAGAHAAAAAAHDSARALLRADARCAWDDVSPWLPDAVAAAYRRLPCGGAERRRYEARFWRLAQPFWALPGNDLRDELAARRTLARLHAAGQNPHAVAWGSDIAELQVRYGSPVAWAVRGPAHARAVDQPAVFGYEPTPSYDFTPVERALAPATLLGGPVPAAVRGASAWALRRPLPQTRYAPLYTALGVTPLDHQLARFRRGDSLLVVAAYSAPDGRRVAGPGAADTLAADTGAARPGAAGSGTAGAARAHIAALVVDDSAGRVAAADRRDGAPPAGVLRVALHAPDSSGGRQVAPLWLASVEVLDTAARAADRSAPADAPKTDRRAPWRPPAGPQRGRAARVRAPLVPLPADVALSDLLLVRPGDYGAAPDLATVIDSAAGAPVVRAGDAFGVYWEQYAPAAPGAPRTVAITATRMGVSALERLGALVGRAVVAQPVSLRYADPVPPTAGPGRYVSLRWPVVPPGTYRLSVRVGTDAVGLRSDPPGSGATPADTAAAGTTAVDTSAADTAALPPAAGPAAPGAVATLIVRVVR